MIALALLATVAAQAMNHSHMPGMTMPMPKPTAKAGPKPARKAAVTKSRKVAPKPPRKPVAAMPATTCSPEHAAMGHCAPPEAAKASPAPMTMTMPAATGDCPPEHAAMGHCSPATAPAEPQGTARPAGNAPAPTAPSATYADRIWGAEAMASARSALRREHGGMQFSQVMLNLAEVDFRGGRNGYRWDGEAWFGGDINRLAIKSEGEGAFGDRVEGAEIQALYSRAIDPYFNLQAGVRQGIGRGAQRTDAVLGVEGLAPYWFDVEAALFLSDKGDLRARAEGTYDQRITQRLILQPRVEVNWSAQDMRAERIGGGLTDAEAGLRLRYEIAREFAPYVGVAWERRFGRTARYARADDEGTGGVGLVLGVRAWF
ncbi:copper resistance protein CopB [Sphingomonas sp. Leaf33]|uniref:copper resistance protein B n=1 Tax=Sphingomonas sp. Leaf33 TaxID=1736215 RepID=UPI0006F55AAB|nr:copper resistance protein B [Sphingomonas sp. Leaf33]KQN19542.1 copper resistance protein CopB [Sphingomonas sp. Leaf33]